MFRYIYPIFEHKNLLKKDMLDELRDYPLLLSRMYLSEWGSGIIEGCGMHWEQEVLCVEPGLIHFGGQIYRMEEPCLIDCPHTGERTCLKVRFSTMEYERGRRGGIGEILLDSAIPGKDELELGRFLLQEGARLRTVYENFEDYQTEYDTVNRIHVPYAQTGGAGLWPQLLKTWALELLETETVDVYDVSFAMNVLGAEGRIAPSCVRWYVQKACGQSAGNNEGCYRGLLYILKSRKNGDAGYRQQEGNRRQMLLL